MKISNEFKIGFWSIISIIVLVVGIQYLKGINLLRRGAFYHIVSDNVEGLAVSSHVLYNGLKVGLVRDLKYDDRNILITINIEDDISLPEDSHAEIQTDLLGTSSIVLRLGKSHTYLTSGDTLLGGNKAANLLDKASPLLPAITDMMPKIDSILTGLNIIVNQSELQESLLNIKTLTSQLCETTQQLNSLMEKDVPVLMSRANSVAENLDTITSQIREADIAHILATADKTLTSANELLAHLSSDQSSAGKFLTTTELHDQLTQTITEMQNLIADIKQNPKRYINISVFGSKNK